MRAAYNRFAQQENENYSRVEKQKPPQNSGGLNNIFNGLLPFNMNSGDILLLLILYLLYRESRDEEFLIILAVVALSIFRGQ